MNRDHYFSKRQQSFLRMSAAYQSQRRVREHDDGMLALPAVPDENRRANAESAAKPEVRSPR